ncbi:hypothetical protein [Salipaludibacillus agaradhaerens]|nr:hypothetical protein [Salipaludibacillus agaradhaerens]
MAIQVNSEIDITKTTDADLVKLWTPSQREKVNGPSPVILYL